MFVEERIYTLQPGRTGDFLKLYEEEALAIQLKHLRTMVGYYSSEIGPLNQIIHLCRTSSHLQYRFYSDSLIIGDLHCTYFIQQSGNEKLCLLMRRQLTLRP
jgi:hypothetical protein